ncbi:MAG: MBL fold metallo-hydrolase [Bacteroidota bacterium]
MKEPQPIRLELPTQFQMKTVNSFLIKEPEVTLIDCGEDSEETWLALESELKENGLTVQDVERIIITHAHVDHMGMAQRISKHAQAPVWVSDKVQAWALDPESMFRSRGKLIQDTMKTLLGENVFTQIFPIVFAFGSKMNDSWKPIDPTNLRVFPHEGSLEIGEETWDVLYVPGHSTTQSCFYQANSGYLLSADMLLSITSAPVIEYHEGSTKRARALQEHLSSFKRLKELQISKVFPGHYHTFENADALIEAQIRRITQRKEQCFQLIQQGDTDFFTLFSKMYPKANFPGMNMLVGYLDLLEDERKIVLEPAFPDPIHIRVT